MHVALARLSTSPPAHCATHRVMMLAWHLVDMFVLAPPRVLPPFAREVQSRMSAMDRAILCARALEVIIEHSHNRPAFHRRGHSICEDVVRGALERELPLGLAMTKIFASKRRRSQGPEARWECVAMAYERFGLAPHATLLTALIIDSSRLRHYHTLGSIQGFLQRHPHLMTRTVASKMLCSMKPSHAKAWWDTWGGPSSSVSSASASASGRRGERDGAAHLRDLQWDGLVVGEMIWSFMISRRHALWKELVAQILDKLDADGVDVYPSHMFRTPSQRSRFKTTSDNVAHTLRYWADMDGKQEYRDMAARWEHIAREQLSRPLPERDSSEQ